MVNCLLLLLRLLSASAVYFSASVEIKIIVELTQPQESYYAAIIPFGRWLIELRNPRRECEAMLVDVPERSRDSRSFPPLLKVFLNIPGFLFFFMVWKSCSTPTGDCAMQRD